MVKRLKLWCVLTFEKATSMHEQRNGKEITMTFVEEPGQTRIPDRQKDQGEVRLEAPAFEMEIAPPHETQSEALAKGKKN
jgi:sortase (surface protein transpeptidase)